jgi:hypothetical protein
LAGIGTSTDDLVRFDGFGEMLNRSVIRIDPTDRICCMIASVARQKNKSVNPNVVNDRCDPALDDRALWSKNNAIVEDKIFDRNAFWSDELAMPKHA